MFLYILPLVLSLLVVCVTYIGYLYYRLRIANHVSAPPGVVLLYQVGRGPRAPSFSPFPLKLETFLRMMKIPYMNDHAGRFSSKGKTPWIEYNGKTVADSQFAIEHLKSTLGVDANEHLSSAEQSVARAFLKLTEENFYWTMCIEMFGEDLEPVKTVIPYRGFKLWATVFFLRRTIAKETWGHGIGRHTWAEVYDIGVRDLGAISNFLGSKPYLMGDEPSEVDCSVFAMVGTLYWHTPGSQLQKYMAENLPNLVSYINRMKERYWPDWDSVTLEGARYTSDHGKIYFREKLRERNEDDANGL